MIRQVDALIGAYIILFVNRTKEAKALSLKSILFTEQEILEKANEIHSREIPPTEMKNSLAGAGSQSHEKYFVIGSEDSLSGYCRLSYPGEVTAFDIGEICENLMPLLRSQIIDVDNLGAYLSDYFDFVKGLTTPSQQNNQEISTREATWIAAAVLTYNQYCRTQSSNIADYAFQQTSIANLALQYNNRNSIATCRTHAQLICVQGSNNQGYAYLIDMGNSRRRIAVPSDNGLICPENLHMDFVVNTINGQQSASMLKAFIENEFQQLVLSGKVDAISEVGCSELAANNELQMYDEYVYGREHFLSDVYIDSQEYDILMALLKKKKNLILQGPPGVGKTYAAQRIAYAFMGVMDPARVCTVQFHQSYSYEDFVMGYRPSATNFELKTGVFYDFCKAAERDLNNDYVFIIDEINRGNLSKIFGELFMLIESDKRGNEIRLLYSDERFAIPENVYLIGLMNTADRSLAMLDYALRRRFAFYDMKPSFSSKGFRAYQMSIGNRVFDSLISMIEALNVEIRNDAALGEGFCIGHSFFCNMKLAYTEKQLLGEMRYVVEYELVPLLKEYWYDEQSKVHEWQMRLRSCFR